ncbi:MULTISPECIES: IclR family transcriptional regulator [Carboxydothermus]|uniref:Glycerol operon regulatory protein n=2 Tax=Carboxydothermus TaxID=129957 RepID=Q3ACM7_CARHZ|nr:MULTISPECIES: IclR family transcriptional regulator [Carboxydothermus]ABB14375.1 transcriptional regulator, IclR family [Carboxydothermus hydrogenoformans Z-2901]NYE58082.1 DNA-binding IclR family transcriptional regulator [Carboxydothermus ferrireducens DSM 11255]
MKKNNNDTLIQSVDRALRILDTFSLKEKELGVTEIANRLGLHKSTVFGLLRTLEHWGYVEQNQVTGKYRLGLKLLELGNRVKEGLDLRAVALPFLQDLVERYGETVHLAVHDRGEIVYIEKVEGPNAIRMYSQIGRRAPMHCTGVGKAILAFRPEKEIEEIIRTKGLKYFTPNTITDPKKLHEELSLIRENGYSLDREEIEIGLRCVAAPIRDSQNTVVAAISVAGPSIRMTEEKIQELIVSVKEAALEISKRLGYQTSSR